ncbi:AMP-binding protein [Streptomyces sp. NPDC059761]|uniref:AMP-binding protein n=1 Tax=Streptomyces sp. NPDC059761 TaxID=3346937 RepID=UPI003660B52E
MTVALHDLLPAGLRRSWAVDGTCPDLDLYSLFRARQIADLHATAVVDAKGKLCYTALDRKVRCLAAGLAGLGIRPGEVVGVQLPNGRAAVIADLALAAVGAVALPFPVGRGSLEAQALLRRAEAVAVIAPVEHRGSHPAAELRALVPALPELRHVIAAGRAGSEPEGTIPLSGLLRSDPAAFVPARPDPDSAARILVSSGSEAEPKMVAYSHNALAGGRGNFLASLIPDGTPPRCLFLVPLGSAFGSNGTAVTLARHGGTLILLDHFTPEAEVHATGVVAGRPDPRVADIHITDPDTHEQLPDGEIGEIIARGPMTPMCYVASPELDARYRTPEGWVRTGDLGLIDEDGVLHLVGRLKDIVIRGGANISPAEVERELAAHPRVRDVVCVGIPDRLMGERLAACVVPRGPEAPTLDSLGEHLTRRGLERRKHPERLLVLAELPLTPAGKPDRAALRERLAQPARTAPTPAAPAPPLAHAG